jgi:geranylgeranylglycerol-phosphate geranylgeranyltransferase
VDAAAPITRSPRSGLIGLVRLVRPLNVVMFFAGVALGGLLAAGPSAFVGGDGLALALAVLSAACIGAGANAINDVFDVAIDRVNRPDRPLPSGAVTVGAARGLWAVNSALGIGLSAFLSMEHLGIALFSVLLLYGYSAWLKKTPLAGNLAVALVLGFAILYGGLAVAPTGWAVLLLGAGFAAGTTLAREVAKDIEDAAGDATEGARTLPLVAGPKVAVAVVVGVTAATLAAFPLALEAGLGADFFLLALPAAGLLLAAVWALLRASGETLERDAARASLLLKAAMIMGILALAGARLVG